MVTVAAKGGATEWEVVVRVDLACQADVLVVALLEAAQMVASAEETGVAAATRTTTAAMMAAVAMTALEEEKAAGWAQSQGGKVAGMVEMVVVGVLWHTRLHLDRFLHQPRIVCVDRAQSTHMDYPRMSTLSRSP